MTRFKMISVLLWSLALGLMGWILSQLPVATLTDTLGALHWQQAGGWVALNLLVVYASTQRWRGLLTMLGTPVGFVPLTLIRLAGQTVSFITPGPQFGGEPLQIYWLYRRCVVPIHKAVLSLSLDRFFELWVNFSVLLLGVALLILSSAVALSDWFSILLTLLTLVSVLPLLGVVVSRRPRLISKRLRSLVQRWQDHPRLRQIDAHWQALGDDLQTALSSHRSALITALLWSVLSWAGVLAELWWLLRILDLQIDEQGFILIVVAIRLAMLLPLPGGIGTIEAALLWSFQMLELPTTAAIGLIALMRMRDAVILVTGMLCLRAMQARTPDGKTERASE